MNKKIGSCLKQRIELRPRPQHRILKKICMAGTVLSIFGITMILCLGVYDLAVYGLQPVGPGPIRDGVSIATLLVVSGLLIGYGAFFIGTLLPKGK